MEKLIITVADFEEAKRLTGEVECASCTCVVTVAARRCLGNRKLTSAAGKIFDGLHGPALFFAPGTDDIMNLFDQEDYADVLAMLPFETELKPIEQ